MSRARTASLAARACIAYNECMQYTLRNVPKSIDAALRRRAKQQGKSLNEVAIEALSEATGEGKEPIVRRDLSDIVGTWVEDPETEAALREFREVNPADWR